jgi:hypothetical protein
MSATLAWVVRGFLCFSVLATRCAPPIFSTVYHDPRVRGSQLGAAELPCTERIKPACPSAGRMFGCILIEESVDRAGDVTAWGEVNHRGLGGLILWHDDLEHAADFAGYAGLRRLSIGHKHKHREPVRASRAP